MWQEKNVNSYVLGGFGILCGLCIMVIIPYMLDSPEFQKNGSNDGYSSFESMYVYILLAFSITIDTLLILGTFNVSYIMFWTIQIHLLKYCYIWQKIAGFLIPYMTVAALKIVFLVLWVFYSENFLQAFTKLFLIGLSKFLSIQFIVLFYHIHIFRCQYLCFTHHTTNL